jgi:hypothetical protein
MNPEFGEMALEIEQQDYICSSENISPTLQAIST